MLIGRTATLNCDYSLFTKINIFARGRSGNGPVVVFGDDLRAGDYVDGAGRTCDFLDAQTNAVVGVGADAPVLEAVVARFSAS